MRLRRGASSGSRPVPSFLALTALLCFAEVSPAGFTGLRLRAVGQRSPLQRPTAGRADTAAAMPDTAPKEESTFPKAFVFLNVLNIPLALADWRALALAVPLTGALAKASIQKPDGQPFDAEAEQSGLNAVTITSPANRLIRIGLGTLHVLVGVRCAARFTKTSLLWSGVNFMQILGAFVVGGMWLTTGSYGQ
eukprot:TRINITY_DN92779_c0_g1_i1.p1 TRINITY_DN92779_c0_g1~~TRINITY_DN92779_c0_g1_i1.p1  ORF type:complete len:193 (-),score=26.63 TRINITY_DN92779_c0_g1_i1:207-785(-)